MLVSVYTVTMATLDYLIDPLIDALGERQVVFATFYDDPISPTKLYFLHDTHNIRTNVNIGHIDLATDTVGSLGTLITTTTSGTDWSVGSNFSGCYCPYNGKFVISLPEKLMLWDGTTATLLETSARVRFLSKVFPSEPQYFYVFSDTMDIQKWDLDTDTLVSEISQSWVPASPIRFADYLENGEAWLMTKAGDVYQGTWGKSGTMTASSDYAIVYTNAGTLETSSSLTSYPFQYSAGDNTLIVYDAPSIFTGTVYKYDVAAGTMALEYTPTVGASLFRWATINIDDTRDRFFLNSLYGGEMVEKSVSVEWVLNGSGQYEVSSKAHLLQIMTEGSLYPNTGSIPASYWSSDYIQTADIDLESDSNITPIGTRTVSFTGNYDGGSYTISNWIYSVSDVDVGLFGTTASGCTLKHIRLAGTWIVDNQFATAGFVCGFGDNTCIYDIEADFDVGTSIVGSTTGTWHRAGSIVGFLRTGEFQGVTVRGSVNMGTSTISTSQRGGVIGKTSKIAVKFVRNLAHFPNGISAPYGAGGIVAECLKDISWSHIQNAMVGDISSSGYSGGIFGKLTFFASGTAETLVNAMTGDISSANGAALCGTATTTAGDFTITRFANYMKGDASEGMINSLGGGSNNITVENCIIAPNGVVDQVAVSAPTSTGTVSITPKYDDSFGMTFTTVETASTSATLTGFLDHAEFAYLPYLDLSGTDDDGNSYDWDFVYANIGGHADFPAYSHATLHKDDILSPFEVQFDTVASGFDGTSHQLTYADYDSSTVYANVSFTVISSSATTISTFTPPAPLTIEPRPVALIATIQDAGATAYRLTYSTSGSPEVVSVSSTTDLVHRVGGLTPGTLYTISLYINTGSGFVLEATEDSTTLTNSAANYNTSDFSNGSGGFDLATLDSSSLSNITQVMNDLFTTGDKISLKIGSSDVDTKFVKRGETASIEVGGAILVPFSPSEGSGQSSTLTLSDTSTVDVTYDESTEEITVSGQAYTAGQSFVLDGQKVSIVDI